MAVTPQVIEKLRAVKGQIYSIETFGTVDGPGIRYVLFLQGCPLRCLYCHNPDSVTINAGKEWSAGEAVDDILRYKNFIKSGGVTFSGGEPLLQPEFLIAVSTLLKEEGLHIAIDTAGCMKVAGEVKEAVDTADLLLLDIKALEAEMAREISGKTSDQAFEMLDYCESIGKPVWVRQVLLKGYTLDKGQLTKLAQKLAKYSCIERVELLPFHKLGEPKWQDIDRPYTLYDTPATTKEEAEWAREIFRKEGIKVQ